MVMVAGVAKNISDVTDSDHERMSKEEYGTYRQHLPEDDDDDDY